MVKESFDKIVANAEMAKETVERVQGQLTHRNELQTYFHLRPTTAGVVAVSTLPYAPMSGVLCTNDLEEKIKAVDSKMGAFISNDTDYQKVLGELKSLGFGPCTSAGAPPLAAIQSAFITEMNQGNEAYGELKFVASEFVIPKAEGTGGYCFHIVAYNSNDLYFIEIRSDRSETVFAEMGAYMTDLYRNQEEFVKKLMAVYPLTAPGTEGIDLAGFHRVQGIVAMPEGENITVDWQKLATDNNLELWFYQPAFAFRKYLPMGRTAVL